MNSFTKNIIDLLGKDFRCDAFTNDLANAKTTTGFYINSVGGDYTTSDSGLGAVCWVAKGYIA